jgi:hypothetical protein
MPGSEIALRAVGYSDVKAFRGFFRKYAGASPPESRARYNREAAL